MARPAKTTQKVEDVVDPKDQLIKQMATAIESLSEQIDSLNQKLVALESKPKPTTIHKVETYNGDVAPEVREESGMKMTLFDKIQSMKNAIVILPPNLKKDGRHEQHNIEAVCGFKVDQEMIDAAYEGYVEK